MASSTSAGGGSSDPAASSSSFTGKRKVRGYWWDPKATSTTLLERFGSQFDTALCPGVKPVDSPELKAAAYIQAGLGFGFYDNEECAGDVVWCHATSVPANSCPPSWAVLDPNGPFFCGPEGDKPVARWRGAYFSLGGLSQSTDSDKHWLICLHPGCGAKVAGFSNFNSQHRPRHSAWTFTSDKHDKLSLRPSESVLRASSTMIPQQLFAAKASVRVKTKKELAEELALYHARTPGTSYEALGGDAMHMLISGVTGIDLKNLSAPRRGMIIKAHHKLFEAQQAQVLAEVRAALEEARRLRLEPKGREGEREGERERGGGSLFTTATTSLVFFASAWEVFPKSLSFSQKGREGGEEKRESFSFKDLPKAGKRP